MKKWLHIKTVLAGAALLAGALAANAQTGTTAPMGSTQAPTGVGVTPQTAADANQQAVPRSDTGTVVRTSPNAVDSARTAASGAMGSSSGTSSGMSGSTGSGMSGNTGTVMRPPRADRN